MRVRGTRQLKYTDGVTLNRLGDFPQIRAKELLSYPRNYLFDFGLQASLTSSPDINNNYWNNFTGQANLSNIKTSKNLNTNINVVSFAGGFGSNNLGGLTNPNTNFLGDLAISSATTDYYFNATPTNMNFRISNLNKYNIYDFGFFGSRNVAGITTSRITTYFVSGGNGLYSGNLITTGPNIGSDGAYDGNDNTILYISGVKPNENNQIIFYLNTFSGGFQYLNSMKITERQDEYGLVWSDDFNGASINTENWSIWDHYEGANGELQFYTSRTGETGNINVSGSILYLTARSGSYTSQGPWMNTSATTNFTSAKIETLDKKEFKYGKIEARMRIPSGQGLWPAFWMLGDNYFTAGFPLCGEIDIMEHANVQPNYTSALHTSNRSHVGIGGWVGATNITNYHTQFNIYGMEWSPEKIVFYLNDNIFYTVTKKQAGGGISSFTFYDAQPPNGDYEIYQDGLDKGGRFTLDDNGITITNVGCNYDSTRFVTTAGGTRMTVIESINCNTSATHWPFDQPFWLKLNLAVGGSYGGSPNGGNWTIPHSMEIDWVKVYQKQII